MNRRPFQLALLLTVTAFIGGLRAQAPAPAATAEQPSPEDVAARAKLQQVCTACHELDLGLLRTPMDWDDVISQMASYGAMATDEEFAQIRTYLLRNYAKVNVNAARAQDLAVVLDVTQPVAEALVKYRTDNGPFKTVDDLKKVPGLDAGKLDARSKRITF